MIYWDYSADGRTWVNSYSAASRFSVTLLQVDMYAYAILAETASGSARFANFSL